MAKLYSTAAEVVALRTMCSRDEALSGYMLAHTDSTYYHTEAAAEALTTIKKHIADHGKAPSWKILCEDLGLEEGTRDTLKETPGMVKSKAEAEQLVDALNAYRKTRTLYAMCKTVLKKLEAPKVDHSELIETVSVSLAKTQISKSLEDALFHIGRDADDATAALVHSIIYDETTDEWIPTGLSTFDSVNGGLPRGGLCLVGASSGAGKSILLMQLAKNQAELGYKVVVVPLEMTEREQLARLLANVGEVDSLKINLKKLNTEEKDELHRKYRRFNRKVSKKGGRLTIFRPKVDMDIQETLAAVHSFNPDVVYIDYIGLLKGADGDDQWRMLGQIARYGKVYAGNHNKVVCFAAQVNDEGKVRYSQAIKEHSSLGFVFVATKESREKGYLNISMIKGRNQLLMDFTLRVDYQYSKIYDMPAGEVANGPIDQDKTDAADDRSKTRTRTKGPRLPQDETYMPDLDI